MDFDEEKMCCYMRERRLVEAYDYLEPALAEPAYYSALIFAALFDIVVTEYSNHEQNCFLDISESWQDWFRHFHSIKFLVRRLETPHLRRYAEDLFVYKSRYHVSDTAVRCIIKYSTICPEDTLMIYEKSAEQYGEKK